MAETMGDLLLRARSQGMLNETLEKSPQMVDQSKVLKELIEAERRTLNPRVSARGAEQSSMSSLAKALSGKYPVPSNIVGDDIVRQRTLGGGVMYRLPNGGYVEADKVPEGFGKGSFVGAKNDAEARKNLVTNLGLKDESELTRDAYGNISNVADRYKQELRNIEEARRQDLLSKARDSQRGYLEQNLGRDPAVAEGIIEQETARQQQEFENQKSVREYLFKKLETESDAAFNAAQAEKYLAEARQLDSQGRQEAVKDMMKTIYEGLLEDGSFDEEDQKSFIGAVKLAVSAMGDHFGDDGVLYSREDIEGVMKQYGVGRDEAVNALMDFNKGK